MKFSFYSIGCKVNRAETQALSQLAQQRGHQIVESDADACIVNTCTVTSTSDHKNIRMFHRAKKENPQAIIAAIGCFAQMEPQKVQAQAEIDLICGTGDRVSILERCENLVQDRQQQDMQMPSQPSRLFEALPAGVPSGRTRALLKIQDGCDQYCSYCIIPYARGHVRSMPVEQVLEQVVQLSAQGVREIVLAGIEISSYGVDLPCKTDLQALLVRVCHAAPEIRVRLSSLEPRTMSEAFCTQIAQLPNLMPHFHLSLQSGCDAVLARMKRRYTTADYAAVVKRVRSIFPQASITTDVIVGFPQETEDEFQQTVTFVKQCAFAEMHIFSYSPRKGTVAAAMPHQIAPQVKKERADILKQIARDMQKQFLNQFIGQELDVLLEHPLSDTIWSGHARYHFQVAVETAQGKKNTMVHAQVTARTANGLAAKEI